MSLCPWRPEVTLQTDNYIVWQKLSHHFLWFNKKLFWNLLGILKKAAALQSVSNARPKIEELWNNLSYRDQITFSRLENVFSMSDKIRGQKLEIVFLGQFCLYLALFNTFWCYIFWDTVYCIVSNFRHFRIGCPTWKSSRPWWQPLSTISTIRAPPTTFTSIQARVWLLSITTELSWKTIMFRHFSGRIYNLFLLKKYNSFI